MTHDFNQQLEYSLEASDDEEINKFYFRTFKDLERIETVTDLKRQYSGIDKILHLRGGKELAIDEKKRRKVWPDIALEVYSNYEKRTPGWTFKPNTDYILYVFMPIHTCYLLPTQLLKIWIRSADKSKYKIITAQNLDYKTVSIAVPIPELLDGLRDVMSQPLLEDSVK